MNIPLFLLPEVKMSHPTQIYTPTGGVILGALSDRYGRKPAFVASMALCFCAGVGAAAAPFFEAFVFWRFVAGVALAGVDSACFVMGMELVGPSKRTLAGILCWFFETGMHRGFRIDWSFAYTVFHSLVSGQPKVDFL